MRIALFSDVHANPVALDAVLEDMAGQGIDLQICLGDLVGAGPDPAAVVEKIRRLNIPAVKGNWDDAVVNNRPFIDEEYVREHVRFTRERLAQEQLDYLAALPLKREWTWEGVRVEVFHATPDNVLPSVLPDAPQEEIERQMASGADVVVYGHIHRPFVRWGQGRVLISVGYCSLHLDGDPRAAYTILELGEDGNVSVTQRRVSYDRRRAAALAAEADMPVLEGFRRLLLL